MVQVGYIALWSPTYQSNIAFYMRAPDREFWNKSYTQTLYAQRQGARVFHINTGMAPLEQFPRQVVVVAVKTCMHGVCTRCCLLTTLFFG